jgi:serine/threonine protein kinase
MGITSSSADKSPKPAPYLNTIRSVAQPIPSISHLPDNIQTEFKEYDIQQKKVINTYVVLEKLGKGGFGSVYKVQHAITNDIYALKYISLTKEGFV